MVQIDIEFYEVATISSLLKIIGLFCKRVVSKRLYCVRERYDCKEATILEPTMLEATILEATIRRHPIVRGIARECQLVQRCRLTIHITYTIASQYTSHTHTHTHTHARACTYTHKHSTSVSEHHTTPPNGNI